VQTSAEGMTLDEAKELIKGPLGKELSKIAASYVAPLFWEKQADSESVVLNNGSIFFLDCGEGLFAVTADHVYQAYLKQKEKSPNIVCQILNLSFKPEERRIDSDADFDIATFRISKDEVEKVGKAILMGNQSAWPPKPPQEGKGVFFAGFPGKERLQEGPRKINFGIFHGACVATSVSERQISVQVEHKDLVDTGFGIAPENYDLGGLSGAPLLTLVEHKGVMSWRLGGVIRSAHPEWAIFKATRADCILMNGRLRVDSWEKVTGEAFSF